MNDLNNILKPVWGAEEWILEGWEKITAQEKEQINDRMNELFCNGLPFTMKYDKLFYIYTFSLLAQLEVLAIQVPLKFKDKMSTKSLRDKLHQQLLDEIFHGLAFTKIVYLLCEPYAYPPQYNDSIEALCDFIRKEDSPQVALMLLNMIGEGWIEEIFSSLHKQHVAPKVFDVILADEHRHVCEADLYRDIGLPNMDEVREKMAFLENQLLTGIFLQYKYVYSACTLMGVDGTIDFLQSLNKKHHEQLKKINLVPSENWYYFMKVSDELFPKIQDFAQNNHEVPMTSIRKIFMTQWGQPSDPTMVGEFNLNVSAFDFFNKKYPPEAISMVSLQAISLGLALNPWFRNFLSHHKLYRSHDAFVGLVVKLPDCGDHIGMIIFKNCHEDPFQLLVKRVKTVLQMMVYCYKKREELEAKHPYLIEWLDQGLFEYFHDVYGYPMPGSSIVSLSNIGACGYTQTKSPLRHNESMKFTLLQVEKKPVWNAAKQSFEPQDLMPVSVSADHRIFDGNIPVPKLMAEYFEKMFIKMQHDIAHPAPSAPERLQDDASHLPNLIEDLIARNVEAAYRILVVVQTYWYDSMQLEGILSDELTHELLEKAQEPFVST